MTIVCTVTNDLTQDQRMDRICRSLVTAGYEVLLVGRALPTSQPLAARPYATLRLPCRYQRGKMFYLEYNWRLWWTLRRRRFSVICAVDLDTLVAGYLLKGQRRKLVYDAHEWFSETPEVVNRPLTRMVWHWVGKLLVPRADVRYTVAPRLAEQLAATYGRPFGTVRNLPLRSVRPAGGSRPEPKILLYQGMFNPGRGLEVAIEAMQWLPECQLLLVGDGPEMGALRRCREKYGVQGRVILAGFRPPAELPAITRRAWLGLNLLEATSPSYYYSLANKALDYVQAEVPSVQMDFPEYRALQAQWQCYRLLEQLDARQLVTLIRQLLDHPEEWQQLRENCQRAAATLHWGEEEKILLRYWAALGER